MSDPVTSTSSGKKNTKKGFDFLSKTFFFLEGKVYFGEVRGKSEEVWGGAGPGGEAPDSPVLTSDPPLLSERRDDVLQRVYGKTAARDATRFPKNIFSCVTLERSMEEMECVCVFVCVYVCVCIQLVCVGVEGLVWFVVSF